VAGILIAFQLDRWSEGWRGARDRNAYHERLIEESSANVDALTGLSMKFNEVTREVGLMARAVGDSGRPATVRFTGDRACRALQLPAPRLQTAALEETGDPAALQLVTDATLRRLIHDAAAQSRYADRQIEYFRDTFQRFGVQFDPYANWSVDPRSGEIGCKIDFEGLAREPGVRTLLTRIYRDRLTFGDIHESQIKAQRAVGLRAACLLNRTC
jgi:hypothetical protein